MITVIIKSSVAFSSNVSSSACPHLQDGAFRGRKRAQGDTEKDANMQQVLKII